MVGSRHGISGRCIASGFLRLHDADRELGQPLLQWQPVPGLLPDVVAFDYDALVHGGHVASGVADGAKGAKNHVAPELYTDLNNGFGLACSLGLPGRCDAG